VPFPSRCGPATRKPGMRDPGNTDSPQAPRYLRAYRRRAVRTTCASVAAGDSRDWSRQASLVVVHALFRHVTAGREPHDPVWTTKRHAALSTGLPSASSDPSVYAPIYRVIPTLPGQGRRELPPLASSSASRRRTEINFRMPKEDVMTCPAAIIRHYKSREQVRGYLASRGFQRTLEGWRNSRWIGRVSRDDGGFWVELWPPIWYFAVSTAAAARSHYRSSSSSCYNFCRMRTAAC